MQISYASMFYLTANCVVGAINAASNPSRWIACFALGVLAGSLNGKQDLNAATRGYQGLGWDEYGDLQYRKKGVSRLLGSLPGPITTIANLIAWHLRINSSSSRLEPYVGGFASFALGHSLGNLIFLDILRRNKDQNVRKLLRGAIV